MPAVVTLPSQPSWLDGLPRIQSRHSLSSDCEYLDYAITVPGGGCVALCSTELLAREFIGWLGQEYADRALHTMRALDELTDPLTNRSRDMGLQPERSAFRARRRGG